MIFARKLVSVLMLFMHVSALACEMQPEKMQCLASITHGRVMAYFPVKKRPIWEWYKTEDTETRPEYGWIAEPGVCVKGKFAYSGIGFAASAGSLDLSRVSVMTGTLADLLNYSDKAAYWSPPVYYANRPQVEGDERVRSEVMENSRVSATSVEYDNKTSVVFLVIGDRATVDLVKSKKPTHMKMRVILSNPEESYRCIARIVTMDAK